MGEWHVPETVYKSHDMVENVVLAAERTALLFPCTALREDVDVIYSECSLSQDWSFANPTGVKLHSFEGMVTAPE